MAFRMKLNANTFFEKRYMVLNENGIVYCEGTLTASRRHFPYAAIEYVIVSPINELSFQVGNEIFTLPLKPAYPDHQAFVNEFISRVQATAQPKT